MGRVAGRFSGGEEYRPDPIEEDGQEASGYVKSVEDGASARLVVMRHVNLNTWHYDVSEEQRTARRLKEKDPKGFMVLLDQMERERAGSVVVSGVVKDMGTERVLELIGILMKKWEGVRNG